MTRGAHIIEKQVLNLSIGEIDQFHPIADEMKEVVYGQFLPALSAVLDDVVPPEIVLTFDHIEIDLGIINWKQQKEMFSELMIRQVVIRVKEELNRYGSILLQMPANATELHQWAIWERYLCSGMMPWFAKELPSREKWELQLLAILGSDLKITIEKIIARATANPLALKRLFIIFSSNFVQTVLQVDGRMHVKDWEWIQLMAGVMNTGQPDKEDILKEGLKVIATGPKMRDLERIVFLLDHWVCHYPQRPWPQILKALIKEAEQKENLSATEFPTAFIKIATYLADTRNGHEFKDSSLSAQEVAVLETFFSLKAFRVLQGAGFISSDQSSCLGIATPEFQPKQTSLANKQESDPIEQIFPLDGNQLYASHTGVVILGPFLPAFFEACELLKNEIFIDKKSSEIAVRLTGFLSTGNTSMPDWELVAAKILCGLQPGEPIGLEETLKEEWLVEASHLLNASIKHWGALGKSGVDALREAFLSRKGKFTFAENKGWLLQVEPQTIDVLLGKLPWGFGHLKLPWMAELLITEWEPLN